MKKLDRKSLRRAYPSQIWRDTLKRVVHASDSKFVVDNNGLTEEEMQSLRWICAYADIGFNPPPKEQERSSVPDTGVSEYATYDAAMFNYLASVHSTIDINSASEVMRFINS